MNARLHRTWPEQESSRRRSARGPGLARQSAEVSVETDRRTDFRILVIPLATLVMAYPALMVYSPFRQADKILLAVSVVLAPLILSRLNRVAWPTAWLTVMIGAYAVSNRFEGDPSQGFKHTVILACMAVTFLTFATYGAELIESGWGRLVTAGVVVVNIVAIVNGGFPKNATGGALIYVAGIACVAFIYATNSSGWIPAALLTLIGIGVAVAYDFRFLLVCTVVFIGAFFCANRMSFGVYRLVGFAVAVSVVFVVIWFFFSVSSERGLSWQIGRTIKEISGHRANSGRDQLWPYIIYTMQENSFVGLGAGTLPRDFMNTTLSAHSYYIQLYLQLGIVGLVMLGCFLLSLWNILARAETPAGKFGSALFLMFVVHNSTEVIMFQNNALVGVPAWCAIGLAFALERQRSSAAIGGASVPAKQITLRA